jgi:hypothetical protein
VKKIPKRYQNQACHQPPQATLLGLKFKWNNINWTIVAIDPSKGIAKINSGGYYALVSLRTIEKLISIFLYIGVPYPP